MLRPSTPLFNIATDESGESSPVGSPGEPAKTSVFASATALLRGANGNAATIAALRADLATRDATVTQLTADLAARDATITALNEELAGYRAQAAELQAAVTELEKKKADVQTEVIHQLAAAGVTQEALPKGTTSTEAQQTPEELWAAAEAATDAKEKGRLAAKALVAGAKLKAAALN